MRILVLVLVTLVAYQVRAELIHEEDRCTLRGICGGNPETNMRTDIFCVFNEPPEPIDPAGRSRVQSYCPDFNSDSVVTSPSLCCAGDQMIAMEPIFRTIQQFFARCPACQLNLLFLFCSLLCSTDQSVYINATETTPSLEVPGETGATAIHFFLDEAWATVAFNSCKDVQFPAANTKVMDLMCGGYTGSDCTPQRWLDFFGSTSNGFVPFTIYFVLLNEGGTHPNLAEGMARLDGPSEDCANPSNSDIESCSCTDCESACPPLPTIPPPEEEFEIADMDGYAFIMLMVFVGLFSLLICALVISKMIEGRNKRQIDFNSESRPIKRDGLNVISEDEISFLDKTAHDMDKFLTRMFTRWGVFIASYPIIVLVIATVFVIVAGCGVLFIIIITDPVELWSAPGSRARLEKEYFDEVFVPFYRTEQVIIQAPNKDYHIHDTYVEGPTLFGPAVDLDILDEVLTFQLHIMTMNVTMLDKDGNNITITMRDICNQPLAPDLPDCLVQSVLQWWQNDRELLWRSATNEEGKTADWHDHFVYCMKSPLGAQDPTPLKLPCYSAFGGPSYAYVCTGGYNESFYNEAEALTLTFLNNNYRYDEEFFAKALAWEQAYLDYIIGYPKDNLTMFYYSERSVEDEILRSSEADILTIAISYIVIFAYIALALGDFSDTDRLMVDSKITLGLGGVLIVLGAVFSSLGLYGYFGVSTTLIIIEVVPFLILAVGADNMFIFSLEFQRTKPIEGEPLEQTVGRVLGKVGPSLMMTGLSEGVSFYLGALTEMPAVKTFALYAGLAVLLDFVLQVTAFVALLTLDTKRQMKGRLDVLCCVKPDKKDPIPIKTGLVQGFMKKYYGPFLLNDFVRPCVLVVFMFLTCMFTAFTFSVSIGLNQNLAMPRDSYCIDYFSALAQYMKVGPPVYFVMTDGYEYSEPYDQNLVCGGAGCNDTSLSQQIYYASLIKEHTYIAQPASSWIDDYFDWLRPGLLENSCCRTFIGFENSTGDRGDFCPSSPRLRPGNPLECKSCLPQNSGGRPTPEQFDNFLGYFLDDVPNEICNKGGSAAYGEAVQFFNDTARETIQATYFMSYHTPLVVSADYITALVEARELAESIEEVLKTARNLTNPEFSVWPYSLVYVYYEQYLTMVHDGLINIVIAMIPIFIATMFMLGFDLLSAFIIILNIIMVILNMTGVMYLWNIEFNALSLVNLIMAVGMTVEFVSHTTRTFKNCTLPTRKERAHFALHSMGSSVLSGVAMTNLPGIIVLAFAKSQVFEVFYFRMFLTITLSGTWHGLVFLPVVLSYIGPGVNKARLYEEQQEAAEEERLSLSNGKVLPPVKGPGMDEELTLTPPTEKEAEAMIVGAEENMYENPAMEQDEDFPAAESVRSDDASVKSDADEVSVKPDEASEEPEEMTTL